MNVYHITSPYFILGITAITGSPRYLSISFSVFIVLSIYSCIKAIPEDIKNPINKAIAILNNFFGFIGFSGITGLSYNSIVLLGYIFLL